MGLSRNKVAVSEGAAGSPPFYGDRDRISRFCHTSQDEIGITLGEYGSFVVQFTGIRMIFEKDSPWYGGVAQLGEHLPCKQGVMGSNPIISTTRQCLDPQLGEARRSAKPSGRWVNEYEFRAKKEACTHGTDGKNQQLRTVCSSGG